MEVEDQQHSRRPLQDHMITLKSRLKLKNFCSVMFISVRFLAPSIPLTKTVFFSTYVILSCSLTSLQSIVRLWLPTFLLLKQYMHLKNCGFKDKLLRVYGKNYCIKLTVWCPETRIWPCIILTRPKYAPT